MINKKKLLACVCTRALALSLSIPAFAAGTPVSNPTSTTFTGAVPSATVAVSIKKADTKLYVNPYGVPYNPTDIQVKAAGASGDLATGDIVIKETPTSAGFFSDTALIENNSTSAFGVTVTMTSTTKGTVKIVTTAPTTPADNTLFGNFEIADATATTGTVDDVAGVVTVTPGWGGASEQTVPIPAGGATAGTAGTASTNNTNYTLKAATVTTDAVSGTTTTTPAYAAFRLTGSSYVGSTNNAWNDDDLADVTVAFTFAPAP